MARPKHYLADKVKSNALLATKSLHRETIANEPMQN